MSVDKVLKDNIKNECLNPEEIQDKINSLERQTEYLRVLNSFSIALMSLKTLDEVYKYVAEEVVAYLGFEDCVVYMVNPENSILEPVSARGVKSADSNVENVVCLEIGVGIAGSCAQLGESIIVPDTTLDSRYVRDVHLALSEIAVPIILNDQVIGVIDCEHEERYHYSSEHEQILVTVASILSTKIDNTLTLDQLKESVTQLEYAEKLQMALFRIASLTASFDNIDGFYNEVHNIISSLIYAENFYIALYDSKSSLLRFPYLSDEQSDIDPNEFFPSELLDQSLTGWVFRNKKPLLVDREQVNELMDRGECSLYGEICESWLGVPFHSNDEVQGVVAVQSYKSNLVYNEKDKELLIFVSQHISNALERVLTEQKFQHQALHDALTNLPNRLLLMDRIEHAIDRANRHEDELMALMYIDLDRFKLVNDTLGHLTGDAFLVSVSEVLAKNIRDCDTLARLGGDEFAILLEDLSGRQDAIDIADRIINALQQPLIVENHELRTSASIGIAFHDHSRLNAVDLLKQADTAMFKSKDDGRGTFKVFTPDMLSGNQNYLRLDVELKRALDEEELELYYQPIFDIKDDRIVGMEALIRWNHPVHGLVYPGEFIEYAEESNLIVRIDRYVIRKAAEQAKRWTEIYDYPFYISANVCGRSFTNNGFVDYVIDTIKEMGLTHGELAIELTERALISNTELAKLTLQRLRENDIKVLLDDFGTGYSSLSYLHMFPLDCLKIDRSFITSMEGNDVESPLVKTIIALANTLNLKVVAEGVELTAQQDFLADLNCDYGQGYLFSKPVPAQKLEKILMNK